MKNSFIIRSFVRLLLTLKYWFENSRYYKIWDCIMSFFGKLYNKSLTAFIFSREHKDSSAKESIVVRFINFFAKALYVVVGTPCRKIVAVAQKGVIVNSIKYLIHNWQYVNVRYYSIAVFAYGCVSMAIDMSKNGFISNRWILITAVGLVGTLVNTSISYLLNGEFILNLLKIKLFDQPRTDEPKTYIALAWSMAIGASFGAMCILPLLQIFIIMLAAIVVLFVKPRWIVFMTVTFLPFLPTMVVVALMLFSMVAYLMQCSFKGVKFQRVDGFDLAVIGMAFMVIFGTLNSEVPAASAKITAVYLVFIAFFFVLRRYIRTIKNFMFVIDWFILSATIVSGYGIIEQIFGLSQTIWQDEDMFEDIAGRVCSTFENPNVLGEYLLLTIPITIARLCMSKNGAGKFALTASLAMQSLCMIYTYSRGCWVGLIFSVVILLALCARKLFVLMSLGVFALPFVIPQNVIERLLSIGNTSDTSTAYRVFIWEGTARMLGDHWLTGIGLGSDAFNKIYPRYALGAITAPHPHNLYLVILAETGLIGAILFLCVMFNFFRSTGTVCKTSSGLRPMAVALAAGMGGYLVQGLFDNVWYNYRVFAIFFIILAFAAALKDISRMEVEDKLRSDKNG